MDKEEYVENIQIDDMRESSRPMMLKVGCYLPSYRQEGIIRSV